MTKEASREASRLEKAAAGMVTATSSAGGGCEVLTPAEMAGADASAIARGVPGIRLMEAAGRAVAEATARLAPAGSRVAVLAGPGNNGGDGFVTARVLAESGYRVTVALLGARDRLKGDAALASAAWRGDVVPLAPDAIAGASAIVDALFGTGLDRPLEVAAAAAIAAVNAARVPVVAVDIPSGIDGRTGQILGTAIRATETVTFFRLKPGLLLQPGRAHAGRITVADIGIDTSCLDTIRPVLAHNRPGLWTLPRLDATMHKYDRGHAIVVSGGPARTGAARLAARGALRAGVGLVTVASPPNAVAVNAAHLTAIMLLPMDGPDGLAAILSDRRRNAVVLGPAMGVGPDTVALAEAALASPAAVVLDADALTSFAGEAPRLADAVAARRAPVVLTPHEGEFARLFPGLGALPSKVDRAREAARQTGAVIVLKGPDTVVASPDGRAAIADNGPPHLATAGSGDVLSGMIGGLLAQGMAGFDAAAAAVFLHGEAGRLAGRGLIAEDLPEALPAVFTALTAAGR